MFPQEKKHGIKFFVTAFLVTAVEMVLNFTDFCEWLLVDQPF